MSKRQNSLCMFFAPFLVLLCFARLCSLVCFATSKSLYTSRATLYSLYILRAPLQSPFAPQPQKSPHHAQPHRVSIWFAHPCSPYAIKSERVSAYLLPPLQSPNTLRTYAVSIHLANLKSLHHFTQPYAVSIVPERLCSLHMS